MVAAIDRVAMPALHKDQCTTRSRVVDPLTEDGIWTVVDEGCNSCTHSEAWRKNMGEKCLKLGFAPMQFNNKVTQFTGVGTAQTQGKWKIPMELRLEESGLVICRISHIA